jgi:2-polyprenyl-3-methyl-5-hydroxy-6-metoxy-1,4-benzoquinol methylase
MASREELEWWNKFADVMAEQWMLTPKMNAMIRRDYEDDYADYLFRDGGTFLEVGCGVGWIGHKFAARGMQVDGIDFSEGQLEIARRLAEEKGLPNVAYFCRDLVNDPLDGRFRHYDAILINAVLHHLSAAEVKALMQRVASILSPGGKLYIYEPISPRIESKVKNALLYPFDLAFRVLLFMIHRAGKFLRLFKDNFSAAMKLGYTGTSPDEKPIPIDGLRHSLSEQGLQIEEERPFHSYSLAYAMSIVRLRPKLASLLTPAVRLFYKLDAWWFKVIGWQNFGSDKSVLCSIKVRKPAASSG